MVSYFNLMIAASSRRTISLRCAFASGEPYPHDRCIRSRAHWRRPFLFLLRTSAPVSTANGRGATRAHSEVQQRNSIVVDGISIDARVDQARNGRRLWAPIPQCASPARHRLHT